MKRVEWLASEPFTVLLSAGFFGFFAHTGVLAALEQLGVRPRRVAGASAGALAGGLWAAGLPAAELRRLFGQLRRHDFWDPGLPFGGLLRGHKFGALLRGELEPRGVRRIEDCALPFCAVAHDLFGGRTRVLERGELEPAIRASCALPLMFRPVRIDGRLLIDGGYSDRAGFAALARGERTFYHHLPHGSPWSGFAGPEARELEPRPGRLTLVVPGLPRLGPFRLQAGPRVLSAAREHALRWLEGECGPEGPS